MVLDTGSFLPWVKNLEWYHKTRMPGMTPVYKSFSSKTFKYHQKEYSNLNYGTGSVAGAVSWDRFCFEENAACFEEPLNFAAAFYTTQMTG